MFPVSNFAAILNPPQAAILAVGRAESRVVLDGGEPRSVTVCAATLTVDQSRVQGASAAAYLDAFCSALASPETLL
jgi:pyruvate dehydrogenase E2 component (dihydrolipoamide acetyltransferase)